MARSLTVWLFQTGEPLHTDAGNPRPMRAMNLANALVDAGHNVVLWSSAFYHQEKQHRSRSIQRTTVSPQLEIRLIPSPGYQRNIGFGRLWDHVILARNLKQALRDEQSLPEVAFIGYPPIETAAVLVHWLSDRGVPCLLDLKDQWPSLFLDALPEWVRPVGKVLLWPYFHYAEGAMRQASGLTSMAESFLLWGLESANRERNQNDGVFPLTTPAVSPPVAELATARSWWDRQGIAVDDSTMRLIFIGAHMSIFDFEPIKDAAIELNRRGARAQFVICGDGGSSAQLKSMMAGIPNVLFPGWVDRAQMITLAERSQAALIPYRNIESFQMSLPNKVIDALFLGLPVLSPLQGEVAHLLATDEVGLRYGTDSGKTLVECIETLRDDRALRQRMSDSAVAVYRSRFSFETVYGALVRHLEALAQPRGAK